jgi:hypothetical protein
MRAREDDRVERRTVMLLEDKNAIVYQAGAAIETPVARAFAHEGANLLAGRTLAALDPGAEEISDAGGVAGTAQLDGLDEQAVDEHAAAVAEKAGSIDVSQRDLDPGQLLFPPRELIERDTFGAVAAPDPESVGERWW